MSAPGQALPSQPNHRDSLGCSTASLLLDQVLCTEHMVFRRKTAKGLHRARVDTPAQDRGLLIGVSLVDGHKRQAREGNRRRNQIFDQGHIYIRDFDADYYASFDGYFDFFLIELSPQFLSQADTIVDGGAGTDLARIQARDDQVLHHLARALLSALAEPTTAEALFVEQLATAMGAHLLTSHRTRPLATSGSAYRLPSTKVRRAQEMLMASSEEERVSITTIAEALDLSRNHFFRAFRETTGVTPYQWLLNQRIDHARRLLRTTDLSLSEVALHCGFSDQSHFTRVFTRFEGATPGRWRERTR